MSHNLKKLQLMGEALTKLIKDHSVKSSIEGQSIILTYNDQKLVFSTGLRHVDNLEYEYLLSADELENAHYTQLDVVMIVTEESASFIDYPPTRELKNHFSLE